MNRFFVTLPILLALASPLAAKADTVTLTLTPPTESGSPGSTLNYSGTISAPGTNSGLEYLNGDSFNVASPLTLNDSAFFNNAPLFLSPGASFSGVFFSLAIPTTATSGPYTGTFSAQGGSTVNSLAILSTSSFSANVTAATSVTPEPSSLVLLGTGLLGAVGAARRKYRRL